MPFLAPLIGYALTGSAIEGAVFAAVHPIFIGLVTRLGGMLLLSAASKALMPQMQSNRTVTVREPVRARDIVYGRTRKGGTIVFLHTTGKAPGYGTGTSLLHLVVVLSAGPIQSIGAVYFDGVLAVDAAGVAQDRWAGLVTIDKRLGDPNQTAFAGLIAAAGGKWTSAHRLRGVAAVYLTLKYSSDAFPGGIPNISFDIAGKSDVLDPRTGLRGYSENPALCIADYMSLTPYGLGAAIGDEGGTTSADLIEAANICDEAVTLSGGGTEPRYTLNGVITLSDAPKTLIEAMLTSMAGSALNPDGSWRIRAGAYRTPTVSLTPDEARGPLKLTTRVSRQDNFNAVRGKFVSPENDWQPDDFPAWTSATYQTEDNGEQVWSDITLPFTISSSMAQRLAKIHLERRRRQMRVDFAGKLSAWRATVGDVVSLTYARWGMTAKPFEASSVGLAFDGGALVPDLVLTETSPLVYDWTASEQQIYAAAPRSTLPSPFDVQLPGAPTVTESLYVTRSGDGVKALATLIWSISDLALVQYFEVQGSLAGGAWQDLGRANAATLDVLDITPGAWVFQVRAVSYTGVRSAWASTAATIYGLAALPAALTGVTLQSAGGLAVLKWDRHPDLDVRIGGAIVIRHSSVAAPGWSSSVSMDRIQGGQAIGVVPMKPGTYLLAAEDSGGRLGPVTAIATDGSGILAYSPLDMLYDASIFGGTKTGVQIWPSGGLVLTSTATFGAIPLVSAAPSIGWPDLHARAEGIYQFAPTIDLGVVKLIRLRSEVNHQGLGLADRISRRTGLVSSWASFGGAGAAVTDVIMEFSQTPDDPASGGALWSGWARVDAHEMSTRGIRGRARLTTTDAAYSPRVTLLKLQAEAL